MSAALQTIAKRSNAVDVYLPQLKFAKREPDTYLCDDCSECMSNYESVYGAQSCCAKSQDSDSLQGRNHRTCLMVKDALARSGYRLKNVTCTADETTLRLTGTVQRYYHLQMASEIARQLAAGRKIDLQIAVSS